jgi:hypothetical protein
MMSQPPQWPDQPTQPTHSGQPAPLTRPTGSGLPVARFSSHFSSRSQLMLAVVATVSSVLVVTLFGTLLVVLSSHARGSAGASPGGQAQTGQIGQTATAGSTEPAETVAANSTSTPSSSGGGTGGTYRTPTPTPSPGTHAPPSVHQVVNQVTLSGAGEGMVIATCPAGELAVSGGWGVKYNSNATILRSKRSGTGSWSVYVSFPSTVLVTVYAECLANASGATITERLTQVSVASGGQVDTYPTCNAGEVVGGGGFALDANLVLIVFTTKSDTQWWGSIISHSANPALATIYAECLAYSGAYLALSTNQEINIATGSTGSVTAPPCPSGSYLSGGGFVHDDGSFIYAMSAQRVLSDNGSSYIGWTMLGYAYGRPGTVQVDVRVDAICLNL